MSATVTRLACRTPGDVTAPVEGLPVWALIIWRDLGLREEEQVPAIAVAWTRSEVRVVWESRAFGRQEDWLPVTYVWRSGQERPVNPRWAIRRPADAEAD